MHCCCYCYPLRPPKLQHTLDVLTEEGRLDGKILRRVTADKLVDLLMDYLQPLIAVPADRLAQDPHFDQAKPVPLEFDNPVPHHDGTGIDPKNYFRGCLHQEDYF